MTQPDSLLTAAARRALVALVRNAYPHATFPAGPYERTAEAVVAAAAADPRLLALLVQGLDDLDQARDLPFAELDADGAAAVVQEVSATPFFRAVVDIAVVKLYDDHEVWELLGYEGPSFDKGGYIDRGFNDLDWLPEPQIEEATA
jgi:hypothetical protein